MVKLEDIKFDCRLYTGYKPCVHGNECAGCPHYDPVTGTPTPWAPRLQSAPLANLHPAPAIAIIKTGALGDVLRTTTILHPIHRAYPAARVTWITAKSALPLLASNPGIHTLVAMESPDLAPIISQPFDALICLEKEGDALALADRIITDRRAGYSPTPWNTAAIANTEARYLLELGVSDELKFFHNTKSYPHIICEAVGLPFQRDPYTLELTAESFAGKAELAALIQQHGNPMLPTVGLNTGCGAVFRTKQWTLEGWSATAQTLLDQGAANVVLMGGAAELELNSAILARVPGLIDAGCFNPMEKFFGMVDLCDVIVTSDSLGMHIAIAREKYVVALFGSTSHTEIDLYDRGEKVITDFPCSPCYFKTCDKKPTCMQAMAASTVVEAINRGLDSLTAPVSNPIL